MSNGHKTIQFRAKNPVKCPDLNIDCMPGDIIDVHEGYGRPRQLHNGAFGESILDQLCGKGNLEPVDPNDVSQPLNGSFQATPAVMPTVKQLVSAGVPEGIAEQLVAVAEASKTPPGDKTADKGKARRVPRTDE